MYCSLLFLVIFSASALADVEFTVPGAGSTIEGDSLTISWQESGIPPPISDFSTYAMNLCAGGNEVDDFVRGNQVRSPSNALT
jgi:hypothetical protein